MKLTVKQIPQVLADRDVESILFMRGDFVVDKMETSMDIYRIERAHEDLDAKINYYPIKNIGHGDLVMTPQGIGKVTRTVFATEILAGCFVKLSGRKSSLLFDKSELTPLEAE